MPNIAVVWDFDGTLTPRDSTTMLIEHLKGEAATQFWDYIKALRGDQDKPEWEHVLASDAPIWMWALARAAFIRQVVLTEQYFKEVAGKIPLFPNVPESFRALKGLEDTAAFKHSETKVHHFIVSAGLHDLVRLVFDETLVTKVWGCRYEVVTSEDEPDYPECVPVYCMDETAKTRALFEISKGSFLHPIERAVNRRVEEADLFCRFQDMIYVGDGFTDVPSLSLVRSRGGLGIVVCDPGIGKKKRLEKVHQLRLDRRADLITLANFEEDGELFKSIWARCEEIQRRHAAQMVI